MSGESFLYSQHVNVFINLLHGRTRIVDFNLYDFDADYPMRIISDERGRAHYYNNIGAERMLASESEVALAYFRRSLGEDPDFVPAWINLGLLHRRAGYVVQAEVALLHALELDRDNLMAMSNLVSLYEEAGETERAAVWAEKVHNHRMQNPYYRYQLADQAFAEGNYEIAIDNLRYAVRRRPNESAFYYLMSLSYLMLGQRDDAARWMKEARDIAEENGERQRYNYKLDLLRDANRR
jgi:Flp pilus assembly protein TadD